MACSPGDSVTIGGKNSKAIFSSGSNPMGRTSTVVLPVFSSTTPNFPVLPAITVIGDRAILTACRAGTCNSISVTEIEPGGVSSRTCTAMRRSPAPRPLGTVNRAVTVWVASGKSDRVSLSSRTQLGSAPRMRRA